VEAAPRERYTPTYTPKKFIKMTVENQDSPPTATPTVGDTVLARELAAGLTQKTPKSPFFGMTEKQEKVLEALGAFGALRLRELGLAMHAVDTDEREAEIAQVTIDALTEDYKKAAYNAGADFSQVRAKTQYKKLKKPLLTSEDKALVDIATGDAHRLDETAVPFGHWKSARLAAMDVVDAAMLKRTGYYVKQCIERGFVSVERLHKLGNYYLLTKKGAAALNLYAPLATQQHRWSATSLERISAPLHLAAATHYLLYRKNQGCAVWSEYALHGRQTSPTVGLHPLMVSGADFAHQFGRRPDGIVRMSDGLLEVVEAENAEKSLETFVVAMNVLSGYPTTSLHREQVSRLTFVVPGERFDKLIVKAAGIFFDGTHPALGLPKFEGKTSMKGTEREKFSQFCKRIHLHDVRMTEFRASPYRVAREITVADLLAT
jgi:hypothetical protein